MGTLFCSRPYIVGISMVYCFYVINALDMHRPKMYLLSMQCMRSFGTSLRVFYINDNYYVQK